MVSTVTPAIILVLLGANWVATSLVSRSNWQCYSSNHLAEEFSDMTRLKNSMYTWLLYVSLCNKTIFNAKFS
jgi:hypothetical protein